MQKRLEQSAIALVADQDFELVDPEDDDRYADYWQHYHSLVCRRGVSVAAAKTVMRTNNTAIAACMVDKGDADGMICGTEGRFDHHLQDIIEIIGTQSPQTRVSSLSAILLSQGPLFVADAYINVNPSAEEIARTAIAAAHRVHDFGIKPNRHTHLYEDLCMTRFIGRPRMVAVAFCPHDHRVALLYYVKVHLFEDLACPFHVVAI